MKNLVVWFLWRINLRKLFNANKKWERKNNQTKNE